MAQTDEVYIAWESTVYPDGGMYEGLMKEGQCHGKGVFQYADGDRFEGEYVDGLMDGYGVYKWSNGSVFMGSWKENNMHGCGRKFYPGGAIEEGEWVEDDFVGDFTACNQKESQQSMDIAIKTAAESRMFMYKPDGEVAIKNGFVLDQNPMLYAYGTEYLIPGPKGSRFPVPEYAKETLKTVAGLHQAIWDMWNFKIPPQAQLVAEEQKLEKAAAAGAEKVARAQAALKEAEEEDEDDEDDDDDDDDDDDEATPGMASISLSTRNSHRAFEKAARKVVRHMTTHLKQRREAAQKRREEGHRPAGAAMACLSLALRP